MIDLNPPTLIKRYQLLLEVLPELTSILDLNTLLRRSVEVASELTGALDASIFLFDQDSQELFFKVATNPNKQRLQKLNLLTDNNIAGWIIKNRQPVILANDWQTHQLPQPIQAAELPPSTSLIGVPLLSGNKVVGALEVINKLAGRFIEEDLEILAILGAQIGVSIDNARLFQQTDLILDLVHEIRTPLASMNSAIHLLIRKDITDEQHEYFLNIIQDEIQRLSGMTTSFLEIARLESGRAQIKKEAFDVNKLLDECRLMMQSLASESGIKIELQTQENLPKLVADPEKIKQVILNLLSNAIKYNKPTGKITISSQVQGDEMLIQVSDTGIGIPAESLPFLYEKFYRVPRSENMFPGTGLGLSLCKRIIESHHGHLEVQSKLEEGTTISIYLPIALN